MAVRIEKEYQEIDVKTNVIKGEKFIRIQDVVNILDSNISDFSGDIEVVLKEINRGFKKRLPS